MGIYERIKEIGQRKGYSINKIEASLGLPRSSIAKYNASTPSVEKIKQIANLLEVSMDEIVESDSFIESTSPDPEIQSYAQELKENPKYRLLMQTARDLNEDDFEAVKDFAERLRRSAK